MELVESEMGWTANCFWHHERIWRQIAEEARGPGHIAYAWKQSSTWARWVSAYLFLTPFSTIFITQLAPLSLLSPYASLYLPMSLYVISTISTFFPTRQTPTLLSLSSSSQPFTRYQEQDLLVVNFGLLRAISTISMILTIPTISLPPPELLYDLSQCSLQPRKYLTSYLEIVNSLLQHLNLRPYW